VLLKGGHMTCTLRPVHWLVFCEVAIVHRGRIKSTQVSGPHEPRLLHSRLVSVDWGGGSTTSYGALKEKEAKTERLVATAQYIRHGRRCRLHGRLARAQSAAGSPGLGTAWISYPEPAAAQTLFVPHTLSRPRRTLHNTRGTEQHAKCRICMKS
jgi:hypothetical protein